MSEMAPAVSSRTRISPLWIIPIVAVIAGIWMVVQSYVTEGPTITIDFQTAEGVEQGKTKVKMLSVEVGLVEEVTLKKDMSGVIVTVQLHPEVRHLLREDTRFWVVRARVGAGGISGLGTILSGAYIEMAPGEGENGQKTFKGLEKPPLTALGAPGIRLKLTSNRATSISTGDPILYRGYKVGRIEDTEFDTVNRLVSYSAFIDDPYQGLLHSATRFWNSSGFSVQASAQGIEVDIGSVETLIVGGVAFGSSPDLPRGQPVTDGAEFSIYRSYSDILKNPYEHGTHYVVMFDQALGGLNPGAPVEFRGIRIGQVERILLKELTAQGVEGAGNDIPVLIILEPGRLEVPDTPASVEDLKSGIRTGVSNGLRATLKTGNLLTGQQLIMFDYYSQAAPATIDKFDQWEVLPTVESGIGRIEEQVSTLLAKLNALPLDDTIAGVNKVVDRADGAVESLDTLLESANGILAAQSAQALPDELRATLEELRSVADGFSQDTEFYENLNAAMARLSQTLDNLDRLSRELADKPNSVLFPSRNKEDSAPEAP